MTHDMESVADLEEERELHSGGERGSGAAETEAEDGVGGGYVR
jgi:hypothetical protein